MNRLGLNVVASQEIYKDFISGKIINKYDFADGRLMHRFIQYSIEHKNDFDVLSSCCRRAKVNRFLFSVPYR